MFQQQKLLAQAEDEIKKVKTLALIIEDYANGLKDREETKESQKAFNVQNFEEKENIEEEMKNITIRNDGRYMIHKQISGLRVYDYAHTETEAIKKLKNITKKALTYEKKKPKTNYTLKEWAFEWLDTYKKPFTKFSTYQQIEHNIKDEILPKLGSLKLEQITIKHLQEFYNSYNKSRKKEKIILYFNACMQKAVDLGIISNNPCKLVVRDRKIKPNKQPFTIEEQEAIFKAVKNSDIEIYYYLYLLTGMRLNELNNNIEENLTENNQLKILNEKQRTDNPTFKYVDLSPTFVKYLKQNKDKLILKPDLFYRKFKNVLDKLKIEGSTHKLRHTFATNYYYLGVPLKLIQAWCGHSSPDITQNIYIGVSRESIKNRLIKLYNNFLYDFDNTLTTLFKK